MSRPTAILFSVNLEILMSHTIILRQDGIDRTYHCQNKFDAIVLFEALSRVLMRCTVEMWQGMTLVQKYDDE